MISKWKLHSSRKQNFQNFKYIIDYGEFGSYRNLSKYGKAFVTVKSKLWGGLKFANLLKSAASLRVNSSVTSSFVHTECHL